MANVECQLEAVTSTNTSGSAYPAFARGSSAATEDCEELMGRCCGLSRETRFSLASTEPSLGGT